MNQAQEKLIEYLVPHDALVLIHADMCEQGEVNGNCDFFDNLEFATYNMEAEDKPIFFLPIYPYLKNMRIQQMSSAWKTIESPSPMIRKLNEEDIQKQVDYMAQVIGKDPSDIMLAGGGLAAGVCVTDFMKSWCENLYGPYNYINLAKDIPRKIKNGTIFPGLTDITSLL